MTDGFVLPPGGGKAIAAAGAEVIVKVTAKDARSASSFEFLLRPGFDVGAHVHSL